MSASGAYNTKGIHYNEDKHQDETDALISQQTTTASLHDTSKDTDTTSSEYKLRQTSSVLGVNTKRGVSALNVFALFYIAAIMTAVSGFINAQMTFLLQSELHFNISRDVIGRVNAQVLFYANIIPLVLCPTFGYIYDIFGRRIPIFTAIFGSILCMALMPLVSPNLNLLIVCRTI